MVPTGPHVGGVPGLQGPIAQSLSLTQTAHPAVGLQSLPDAAQSVGVITQAPATQVGAGL